MGALGVKRLHKKIGQCHCCRQRVQCLLVLTGVWLCFLFWYVSTLNNLVEYTSLQLISNKGSSHDSRHHSKRASPLDPKSKIVPHLDPSLTLPFASLPRINADTLSMSEDGYFLLNCSSYRKYFPRERSYELALQNVPFFVTDNVDLQVAYYFRWHVFFQHVQQTPDGYVVTEFLPRVRWSGRYNTISCAAGHHIYEGRWLRNQLYLNEYLYNWFTVRKMEPRLYSFNVADAVYNHFLIHRNTTFVQVMYPFLKTNFQQWQRTHWTDDPGCFWQMDASDGMEYSVSGNGCRPTINSMMAAEARALKRMAQILHLQASPESSDYSDDVTVFDNLFVKYQQATMTLLFNNDLQFFTTLSVTNVPKNGRNRGVAESCPPAYTGLANVRELMGLSSPFYYQIIPFNTTSVDDDQQVNYFRGWQTLFDEKNGFWGEFGPTTVERSHTCFNYSHPHECLWNGPSWPFETSRTLTALYTVLHRYKGQTIVTAADFFKLLLAYTRSHTQSKIEPQPTHPSYDVTTFEEIPSKTLRLPEMRLQLSTPYVAFRVDGRTPWIDENIHADDGYWIARKQLFTIYDKGLLPRKKGARDRGMEYLHSSYCDLIIAGLIGLNVREDNKLEIEPLIDPSKMSYFAIDNIVYRSAHISVFYHDAKEPPMSANRDVVKLFDLYPTIGLYVWVNGILKKHSQKMNKIIIDL